MIKQVIGTMFYVDQMIQMIGMFGAVPHIWVSVKPIIEDIPAGREPVDVPIEYTKNGKILLKLNPDAIGHFSIDYENGYIRFGAAFGGKRRNIVVPIENLISVTNNERDPKHKMEVLFNFKSWKSVPVIKNPSNVPEQEQPAKVEVKRSNPLTVVK